MDERASGVALRAVLDDATRDVAVPADLVDGAVRRGRTRLQRRRSTGRAAGGLALAAGAAKIEPRHRFDQRSRPSVRSMPRRTG